jgi:hypothetical protein
MITNIALLNPNIPIVDPATGRLTRAGFTFLQGLRSVVVGEPSAAVSVEDFEAFAIFSAPPSGINPDEMAMPPSPCMGELNENDWEGGFGLTARVAELENKVSELEGMLRR